MPFYRITFIFLFLIMLPTVRGEEWRGFEYARQQIDKHRKADLIVKVVDQNGKPLSGATVEVNMVRHSFPFGAAISALGAFTPKGPNPEMERYLEVFQENFNSAVMENAMKWYGMTEDDGSPDSVALQKMWQCVDWLEEHKIELRGHNVLWPSWENSPDYMHDLRMQPERVRDQVNKRIDRAVGLFKGRLTDWDVVNEPAEHRDIINVLGEDVMIDWYKRAHDIDPDTPMYVNQWAVLNGVFHKSFLQWVNYLVSNEEASLDGIGLQGHASVEQFTEPEQLESVWTILDDYAQFNLPIKITEFDVEGYKGEELQAQALENALTLFFSHRSVAGFTLWGFWDGRHWRNSEKWSMTGENEYAGFWREDWSEKPAATTWRRLVFEEWWTNDAGATDSKAVFKTRGFLGDYEIVITSNSTKKTVPLCLTSDGAEILIEIEN